jgi:hypothetical protein
MIVCFCLSGLNAQDNQKTNADAPPDSIALKKRDSILIKRINSEDMFREKIAVRDSSSFDKKEIKKKLRAFSDHKRWRLGVSSGGDLRIAPEPVNISEELLKYRKSMKLGSRFGADATFFISPNIGLGANYSIFNARNETNHLSYEIDGNLYEGAQKDDIDIHFFGPAISIRSIPHHNKTYASCDFTLGYSIYRNDAVFNGIEYDLSGRNFGFATSISADFMFLQNMSVGVSLNITAVSIKKIENSNSSKILSDDRTENLSRVGLTLTLKTYK